MSAPRMAALAASASASPNLGCNPPPRCARTILRTCISHYLKHLDFGAVRALQVGRKEGHQMKKKLMVLALLAGGTMFAQTRFSIGINVGGYGRPYAPASSYYVYDRPACPGP